MIKEETGIISLLISIFFDKFRNFNRIDSNILLPYQCYRHSVYTYFSSWLALVFQGFYTNKNSTAVNNIHWSILLDFIKFKFILLGGCYLTLQMGPLGPLVTIAKGEKIDQANLDNLNLNIWWGRWIVSITGSSIIV